MSHFAEYMETRRLLPLYEQAAELISLDIPYAIRWCENRSDRKLGYVYTAIAHELNKISEVNYGAAFADAAAKTQAARDAAAAKEREATAAAAAEKQQRDDAAIAASFKVKQDAARAAGRPYPSEPVDIVSMLKHVGVHLQALHKAGSISHDYAQAIQTMIMDLETSIRRSNDPKNPEAIAQRQAAAAAEFEKKSAAAKEVGDMMEIVKTLRANGLPAEVTDHDAAAAYKKLFELLKGVHAAGHSPRKAMEWWVKHEEIGNEHASKEEIAVIDAVLKLGSTPGAILPQPGHHKHVEPEPESDDLPVPDPEDDDEDLMDDEDDDLSQAPAPEPEPEPEPVPAKKPKKADRLFDLKKLAGLNIPAGEENKALRTAVDAAISDPTLLAAVDEPLNKVLYHLHAAFESMKTAKGSELSKSHVSKKINDFFNGKSDNPDMPKLVDQVRKGMEGAHFEQLKDVIKHVLFKMHSERKPQPKYDDKPEPGGTYDWFSPRGTSLQEQQQHSIMLQTLAGIRR